MQQAFLDGKDLSVTSYGEQDERLLRLLLTQGIEVEVLEVLEGAVKLAVRAPSGRLIVEELGFPP